MQRTNSISQNVELSEAKRLLLAKRMKGIGGRSQEAEQIQPRPAGCPTPISIDQSRIWLHASMQPELPTYNEPITLQYRGYLDADILRVSLDYFLQRHEAWRTSFVIEQEEVFQFVHDEVHADLAFIDLSETPEAEHEDRAARLATEQALLPIDLARAPLFRAMLVRIAPDDHRLYMVLHHIIFDGLSIRETFIPELATIYSALESGGKPVLPARTLQYCDYAVWRHQQVDSPAMDSHIEYWREQLLPETPVLRLPSDRPRPPVISQRGDIETFRIPLELTAALRELGQAQGATLYMVMLAVFKVLLFRYSGQEDVIVGAGSDGRRRPELQGMMGYILDTFPVRSHPSSNLPFSTYLGQVKNAVLGGLAAAELPFDRIVQAVGLKRDSSHHPIFQTFFSFLAPDGGLPVGWDMKPKNINGGAAKFDIYFEVEQRPSYIAVCIIYNTDLFDADTIQRLFGHWITLLQAVCRSPDTLLGQLPLLTPEEEDLMLVRWNDRAAPIPATTIHGLVEEQVQRTPNKIAIEFEDRSWTYAELDRESELLASHLRAAGAQRGSLVAVYIDRSEYLVASLLGILKTGAAYLPLDPGAPHARIAMCLEDARPAVVLTQRSLIQDLPTGSGAIVTLEDIANVQLLRENNGAKEERQTGPDDTAYVIHTSGSTGRPKAVELCHKSVVNLLLSMQRQPGFTETDTLVAVTTVSFDIAVLELFLPIISGGRVVIASRGVALDPYQLADLVQRAVCTVMQATPATWRSLLAIDWSGHRGMRVLCGGEPLPRDLANTLLGLGLELWNVYGPTETTIWSTVQRVHEALGPVPIGRPIANTTTYILDANEQAVPIGVAGELYIGGTGLASGYRGQPDLTAEKFVTPAITQGARVYRTGDYAVYRVDGTIECQGRADNQVKIRGYRIELEEVELHLNAHPDVASAAAKTWVDPLSGSRLSAYLVGKHGAAPAATEMREFLRQRLPDYMLPSDFIVLEAMPLTPNGKLDRRALPAIVSATTSIATSSQLALTEEEQKLSKIWAEALGVTSIGRDDNFFDLGGHSLLLVLIFARINKEFNSTLPITTIFDAQTLGALAKVLKEKTRMSSLVPVQVSGTKPPLFMAHSYLLYHSLSSALGPDQPFYGLRELESDGNLSIEERALRYVGDMRSVQPRGPYRIAGWCAAGPLAVEIARQLILAGEKVALLELFDSWLPGYAENLEKIERSKSYLRVIEEKLVHYRQRLHGFSQSEKLKYLWRVGSRSLKELRDQFYIRHWGKMNNLSMRLNIPLPQFMHNTTLQTFAAMRQFRDDSIPVRITLVRAIDSRQLQGATESCGWDKVAKLGVDVLWTPGDHETMFRGRNLETTASLVSKTLANSLSSIAG